MICIHINNLFHLEKRSTGKSGGVGKSDQTVHAGIAKRGISISSSKLY